MFSPRDQYVAQDYSRYPDYDDYERPVDVKTARPERVEAVLPPVVPPTRAVPWYNDRFMLVLVFLIAICLYNTLVISRLEAEINVMNRHR